MMYIKFHNFDENAEDIKLSIQFFACAPDTDKDIEEKRFNFCDISREELDWAMDAVDHIENDDLDPGIEDVIKKLRRSVLHLTQNFDTFEKNPNSDPFYISDEINKFVFYTLAVCGSHIHRNEMIKRHDKELAELDNKKRNLRLRLCEEIEIMHEPDYDI